MVEEREGKIFFNCSSTKHTVVKKLASLTHPKKSLTCILKILSRKTRPIIGYLNIQQTIYA